MNKIAIFTMLILATFTTGSVARAATWWDFQSIDTMKVSRDLAREKLQDSSFDEGIASYVKDIANTGATHIALATPYDSEFLPFLKRWVSVARANKLHVWFRGNFSGWEGWFGYAKISRDEHKQQTKNFILNNKDLFANGDVFTACPECENGGPGDPRLNGDVEGFRNFMLEEYSLTKSLFSQIGKNVKSNYNSMNGDIAKLIMDKPTTLKMDGIVAVDHYVTTPDKLANDIQNLALLSGGNIVLGEFGAPIPDLNGNLNEHEQALWVESALEKLAEMDEVVGVNYWTNIGSSTELWDSGDGKPREVVAVLHNIYSPHSATGMVVNELGESVSYAKLYLKNKIFIATDKGRFNVAYLDNNLSFVVKADSYNDKLYSPDLNTTDNKIVMKKTYESLFFRIRKFIYHIFTGPSQ